MKTIKIYALCVALGFASQSALAFQEDQVGTTPEGVVVEKAPDIGAGFDTTTGKKSAETGTEVRIPGLGSLGVLPKMDFGLELLYGAAATPQDVEPEQDGVSNDEDSDLRIRGSVKHRF